jgi:TrmH family RNA methyltransferase
VITSRDNARVKRWARLCRDSRFRKTARRAVIEGPHLVTALLAAGIRPVALLTSEGTAIDPEIHKRIKQAHMEPVALSQSVFNSIADTETPQGIAAEIEIPEGHLAKGDCVFLEGVQDAGNVGTIIRSAGAFGAGSVVLDRACADPWSPKALRAGMGGHFSLQIVAVSSLEEALEEFKGKLLCTVAKAGVDLRQADLSGRVGWVFGNEGKGVSPRLQEKAGQKVTIGTAAGTESLNVAAAAAICLYESFRRGKPNRPGAGS